MSDVFSLSGVPTAVSYVWGPQGFDAFNPGGIASHHVAAGSLGVLGGIFHLTCRPSYALYTVLRIGKYCSSIVGSASRIGYHVVWERVQSNKCFGPTRYMWDLLYLEATETVVQRECARDLPERCKTAWNKVPDRLAFYDYLGHNPAKGGLFWTGPMVLGDGIVLETVAASVNILWYIAVDTLRHSVVPRRSTRWRAWA